MIQNKKQNYYEFSYDYDLDLSYHAKDQNVLDGILLLTHSLLLV
jgi:hypothetical protein